MAGILDGYGGQQGGILGNSSMGGGGNSGLGLWGAALMDAAAHFSGKPEQATNLAQFQQLSQRQKLIAGLTSQDPNERQQAYQIAPLLGIDPSTFQKGQASQALPKLLSAMQPTLNDNPVTVTPQVSAQVPLNDPSRIAANAGPATSQLLLSDALQKVGSPELSQQYAPEIIKAGMDAQAAQNKPFDLSPGQHHFVNGVDTASLPEKNNPNAAFNADGTPNKAYQVYEAQKLKDTQAPAWANVNVAQQRLGMEQQRLTAGIPNDDTLHDMALRYVSGDRLAAGSLGRNPAAQTAFQNMISQVGKEQGLKPEQISQRIQSFQAGTKGVQAFDTGPQGNTTRSLNVAVAHLDTLGKLSDALQNGDIQAFNKLGNAISAQTGAAAPTNFNAAKAIVGDEIIKAIVGSGGALADRENAQNQLSAASSPAQLAGIIKTYKNLMAGQLHGLSKQYQSTTGRDDFNSKLFPETIAQLEAVKTPPPTSGKIQPPAAGPAAGWSNFRAH